MTKRLLSEIVPDKGYSSIVFSEISANIQEVLTGKLFIAPLDEMIDEIIDQAYQNGASACLVKKGYTNPYAKIPLIELNNPHEYMQHLAKERLAQSGCQVIAITGSVGKSITSHFLTTFLQTKQPVFSTSASDPTHLAISLLNGLQDEQNCAAYRYAVIEMGIGNTAQMQQLVALAPPDIAVLTYIATTHVSACPDLLAVVNHKSALFSSPKIQASIVNFDTPYADQIIQKMRGKKYTYSTHHLLADVRLEVQEGSIRISEGVNKINLPYISLPADHFYSNCLAAGLAAKACGMSWQEIGAVFPQLSCGAGRMQVIKRDQTQFILDSFATAEVSMKAALCAIKKKRGFSKKIAVLYEMPGLGVFSDRIHAQVIAYAADCVDHLFCIGKAWQLSAEAFQELEHAMVLTWSAEGIEKVKNELSNRDLMARDLVLIAGSCDESNELLV